MPAPSSTPLAPHPVLGEYYPDAAARRARVNAMFDASARHYDWITSMMSFGSGRWYRGDALKRYGLKPGIRMLDGANAEAVIADDASVSATNHVCLGASRFLVRQSKPLQEAIKRLLPAVEPIDRMGRGKFFDLAKRPSFGRHSRTLFTFSSRARRGFLTTGRSSTFWKACHCASSS